MAEESVFIYNPIFKEFMLPFVFIFVLVFAILQRTKVLGSDKKQLDSIVAAAIAVIFIGFVKPKVIVSNLILFLTMVLVMIFVGLLIWGFLVGDEAKLNVSETWVKWAVGILITVSVVVAFFWAADIRPGVYGMLFGQSWSNVFWSNLFFIAVIAIVVAVVLKSNSSGGGK